MTTTENRTCSESNNILVTEDVMDDTKHFNSPKETELLSDLSDLSEEEYYREVIQ